MTIVDVSPLHFEHSLMYHSRKLHELLVPQSTKECLKAIAHCDAIMEAASIILEDVTEFRETLRRQLLK